MIRIVTDSTSDIPVKKGEEMGVTVVPLTIRFGEDTYRDGLDLTIPDFYKKLAEAETLPTSSQVNPGEFTALFSKFIEEGDEIVGLFISSDMSGTYQSAEVAREIVDKDRIHLIDSRTTTFGLGLLVHEAVRYRNEGKSAAEIAELLRGLTKRTRLLAVLDTLKYLKMGGRISSTTAFVGGLLGINPVIAIIDGKVESIGKGRGRKTGMNIILDNVTKDPPDFDHYVCFGHSNTPEHLEETIEFFSEQLNVHDYLIGEIGLTVGTHVGPGGAGISYIAKE
jgi:DegV family protein with EDD domain